jgi:hypothetical protein
MDKKTPQTYRLLCLKVASGHRKARIMVSRLLLLAFGIALFWPIAAALARAIP